MRYAPEHKQQTRERVLRAAARSLRQYGPDKVAVADVMRAAGLTHGGFYAHFGSKDELVARAIEQMFDEALSNLRRVTEGRPPADGMRDYVAFYLSRSHWATRDSGCPLASMGTDTPRLADEARAAFERGAAQLAAGIAERLEAMALPQPGPLSVSVLAELVGALVLARAIADESQAVQLLASSREQVGRRLGLAP